MRCFVAINLDQNLRKFLAETASEYSLKVKSLRAVKPDNIHLTLKFLGEVKEADIESVKQALSAAAQARSRFNLQVRGMGVFPDIRRPSVVWAGVDKSKELAALWVDVEKHLADRGFAPESRRFSPHITIARIKDQGTAVGLAEVIHPHKDAIFGSIDVACFSLIRSMLKPEGPVYSVLTDFYLKND